MLGKPRWKGSATFEALVLDLDGVICDTERVVHDVWSEMFSSCGCSFSVEEWSAIVGTDAAEFDPLQALLQRSLFSLPPPTSLKETIDRRVEAAVDGVGALPGVREWMEGARQLGLPVAVASSSPRSWVERRLSGAGVDEHVHVVSCRDDRLKAKPAPDVYMDACWRLGVDPERTVAVEDSTNGIAAAVAAGLTCIAVRNGNPHTVDTCRAHLVLGSLNEIGVEDALTLLARAR